MRHHQLRIEPRAVDDAGQPDTLGAAKALAALLDRQDDGELVKQLHQLLDDGKIAVLAEPCDFVVEGDFHLFNWLGQAAGPAGAGFRGNQAETTDGQGHWLVLEPEAPERNQRGRSRLAHRELRA